MNRIILSIDLDEWYHTRWCTGSYYSMWPNTDEFFRDFYKQDHPIGELIEPTEYLLGILEKHDIKCTFFILGEVAIFYKELVQTIHKYGHEVACHGFRHIDMDKLTKHQFTEEVSKAKKILEEIIDKEVIGFRIPNAVLPSFLSTALREIGFSYDSSVFPSRKFMGKYGYSTAPIHPYKISFNNVLEAGECEIVEFPVAVLPKIRLIAGSGIITRIFGYWWTKMALNHLIRNGDTVYYFHPYELMPPPKIGGIKQKLFLRRCGKPMRRIINKLLEDFKGRFVTASELLEKYKGG